MLVMDNIIYSGQELNLVIEDHTDPMNPIEISRIEIGENIVSINVDNNIAYIGTLKGNVVSINISDLANPQQLSVKNLGYKVIQDMFIPTLDLVIMGFLI